MLAADAEEGWHPWQLDVSEAGGRKVRLTFAADPPAVATGGTADLVAVGSPLLRSQDRSSDLPPIVMISIDTLRPDHLGAFGYSRPTSPFLDSLAAATISFENASSTSAYTLPAHASLLTGQLPAWHRALSAVPGRNRVSPESRLLSELLADRGYVTAAFTGGGYLSPDFGFARGFDLYSTLDCLASDRDPAFTDHPRIHDREGNLQLRRRRRLSSVLDWIGRHRSQPFFLFLHTYAVHNYYPEDRYFAMFSRHGGSPEAPLDRVRDRSLKGPIPAEELESLIDRYDASIRQVDEQLRQLVTYLKDQRLWNRTILVLTSDHGEEFSDHGGMSHGRSLYQEMVHVPLLLHLPTRQPQIIAEPVSLVDVTPTLLDWLDWPGESPLQGQSLLGLLADTPAEGRPLVAELNLHPYHWQMLRQQNFKFLRPDPGERSSSQPALLFDLEQDPQEQRNLLPKQPNLGKNLAAELDRLLSSAPVPESSEGEQELDSAMRRQLEALGYTLEEPNEQ
jgi:arylsulfatase A-like enzyme